MKAALAALLLAIAMLSAKGALEARPAGDLSDFAFRAHPGAHLPLGLDLTDERGSALPLGQFFAGKPAVLVLDYLRCKALCGPTLEDLVASLDALSLDAGRDYEVVAISIDPRDNAADLDAAKNKYLAGYHHGGGAGGWHFLTGSPATVRRIADTVGFPYRYDAALDQYVHPAGFVVVASDGSISRYMPGVGMQPADLRTALADAAQGRAVGLVTRLLLLCHGDDPQLGRYTLVVEAAFGVANLAGMACCAAVFVAIRRRRHG